MVNSLLPFDELLNQPKRCLELAQAITTRYQVKPPLVRVDEGSQLVFSAEDRWIIKLFAPQDADYCQNEAFFLKNLHCQLTIQTPELLATGTQDGYPYLVMGKLQGQPLNHVWDRLPQTARRDIIIQLGKVIRELHSLPAEPFTQAAALFQWLPFIEHQQETLLENHRRFGLEEPWVAQINEYMNAETLDLLYPARSVLLHTELMPEHVFVQQIEGRWTVTGLIDFEPSMLGCVEYEFCAVGLFITRGDKELFRLFLTAYGYPEAELTAAFSQRLLRVLLLHRYCNLKWFFTLLPQDRPFTQLDELTAYWYGV